MAETLDRQLALADVYAAALFALAAEARVVPAVRAELEELVRLGQTTPGFLAFMGSDAVEHGERAASLEKMFRGRLSDLVLDTLQVMNRRGRAGLLEPLLRCYIARQESAAGQVEVRAISAVELTRAQRDEIQRLSAELSGREPLVEYTVDPEIVGGLVLQIGDHRLDSSVRRHLHAARARLLERGERGLPIGASGQ